MQAILLAAGVGQRLGVDHPKCLLKIGDKTLLHRHVENLAEIGITQLIIVTGHLREQVMTASEASAPSFDVREVYNPRYHDGSTISLLSALEHIDWQAPILVMDADVLYHPDLLDRLSKCAGNALLLDPDFEPGPEPVKVCVKDRQVVEFSKQIPDDLEFDLIGESVGFFRICPSSLESLQQCCVKSIEHAGPATPHEAALRLGMLDGTLGFSCVPSNGLPWLEIDFPEDVERAKSEVLPAIARHD